jgi:hypothetical protein
VPATSSTRPKWPSFAVERRGKAIAVTGPWRKGRPRLRLFSSSIRASVRASPQSHHEVHEDDVGRHAVQPDATVKSCGMRVANCVKGPSVGAIYAALFFDPRGRPGPRRRLRRRRPFFGFVFLGEVVPSNDWIAERTSCSTRSRIIVSKLFCLGIESPFPAADTRMADHQQRQ